MAFSGKAAYSDFRSIAEDVSDVISMISPFETPFLDAVGDADRPAANVYHEWMEEALNPNTVVARGTISATTNDTAFFATDANSIALAGYLQAGAVLKNQTTGEYVQVTSAPTGNTLVVTRAFGGTTSGTITTGDYFFVIAEPALEGSDANADISRPRSRRGNYTQIFKKDVIVSGTQQSVTQLGGIDNEFEHQKQQRLREALRDLEKATIQGILSGNSIGTSSAYRTMRGLWSFISTNATSTATLSQDILNAVIQSAWDQGATDLDMIVVDAAWKQVIDSWNVSRVVVENAPTGYVRKVEYYDSTFGRQSLLLNRWMPYQSLIVTSSRRVKVAPLQNRSFFYKPIADTGDSTKGTVIGEYTLEVKNPEGMAKAYGSATPTLITAP